MDLGTNKRAAALGAATALSLFSTFCAFGMGANFGGITYTVLARDLGESVGGSAGYLIYLWFILPAVFIGSRVFSQLGALNRKTELGDPLKALFTGYATGLCFAVLSQALYYSYLLAHLHGEDDFSIVPTIAGLLSDWQSLSGGLIAVALFFALLPWNKPALSEPDF